MHAFLLHHGLGPLCVMLPLVSPSTAAYAQATPTPTESGAWTEVERRELAIEGKLVTLSPDGQWIAGIGPTPEAEFCVWEVETEAAICGSGTGMIDPLSIRWSPDSTAVAHSIGPAHVIVESDIMVFELAKGEFTNLPENGVEGFLPPDLIGIEPFPVDVYPAWSADSMFLTSIHCDYVPLVDYSTDLGSMEGLSTGGYRGYDRAENNTILIPFGSSGLSGDGGVLISVKGGTGATPAAGDQATKRRFGNGSPCWTGTIASAPALGKGRPDGFTAHRRRLFWKDHIDHAHTP